MDFESEEYTPPGSPILGYTGTRDIIFNTNYTLFNTTNKDTNILNECIPVLTFHCKGQINKDDFQLSPFGIFRRNGAILAMKYFNAIPNENASIPPQKFFGYEIKFQSIEIQENFEMLINMCRKRIQSIENMSNLHFQFDSNSILRPVIIPLIHTKKPYELRQDVVEFLTFLAQNRHVLEQYDLESKVYGIIKGIGKVSEWSSSLKHHCGSNQGNECSSPEFHLFHVQLEIRWLLMILFRARDDILNWIIDDLLSLAYFKYKGGANINLRLSLFNCYCVKEFWALMKYVLEENGKPFYQIVIQCINRIDSSHSSFSIWVISNLSQIDCYNINGEYKTQLSEEFKLIPHKNNAYMFLNNNVKSWIDFLASGNYKDQDHIVQIHHLLLRVLINWGPDMQLVNLLWSFWLPLIDKGFVQVRDIDHFSTGSKWIQFISSIVDGSCESSSKTGDPFDVFLSFLSVSLKNSASKDLRKLSSAIFSRMSSNTLENLSENGLNRMISLFLTMITCMRNEIVVGLCERFDESLKSAKSSLRLIKIRGRCSMILILLKKGIRIGRVCKEFMKNVDEILGTIHRSQVEKDMAMVYFDLIENLSSVSPNLDLDQSQLISSNINVWCGSSGTNYLSRTLRILDKLFSDWLLNGDSILTTQKSIVGRIIQEKTEPFLLQLIQTSNDNDYLPESESIAKFGYDLTIFNERNGNESAVIKYYRQFVLSSTSEAKLSGIYLSLLMEGIQNGMLSSSIISSIQFTQGWIRLLIVGIQVPVSLSSKVLCSSTRGEVEGAISSSIRNEVLLRRFFSFLNSEDCFWSKVQIIDILNPIVNELKLSLEKNVNCENVIASSVLALRKISLEKIYARNSQGSFVHEILELFLPSFLGKPPWEKISIHCTRILGRYLHQIFIFIISSSDSEFTMNDLFLKRKLTDTFRFAFLGFVTSSDLDDSNPGLVILRYLESKNPFPFELGKELVGSLHLLMKDEKNLKRFLLCSLGILKRKMIFSSILLFPLILELMVEKDSEISGKCSKMLTNIINAVLLNFQNVNHDGRQKILADLDSVMLRHFSFRNKRFFDYFNSLSNFSILRNPTLQQFIGDEILQLLIKHIEIAECKQGSGSSYSLRTQLSVFKSNLQRK